MKCIISNGLLSFISESLSFHLISIDKTIKIYTRSPGKNYSLTFFWYETDGIGNKKFEGGDTDTQTVR
jgi:hypothetical protein